ncbi:MAG: DUF4293 domain-containing protein [Muribaculaceae bacterium]|jgi:hypothetical protein|nr:DUF4293 family protein [Bacteroidales bacterium]MBQ1486350.1 DUF4293 domain-containing protein [Muribaculaceae bacterium]MBR0492302.1 DUF4293 domain-containing protein [Muribaculaceae bacterium]
MVIQRIQSVYLLIAVILMVVFAFVPALTFELADKTVLYGALETGRAGNLHINPLLITLIILISLLAFIDIFLYKNLQRQMTVCFVDIIIGLAMLVAIGIQAFVVGNREGWTVSWQWYVLLPVLSIIFLMMAHKAMSRDKKKLLDADRLR